MSKTSIFLSFSIHESLDFFPADKPQTTVLWSPGWEPKNIGPISNIDTDAKFRFERGIDQLSIENGLNKAAILIKEICGGDISKIDFQKIESYKK